MSRELVPEMHDMLKLTKYKHDFSDFPMDKFSDVIPKTRTWEGVIGHHLKEQFPAFPTTRTPEVFLLKIADFLASGFSRNKLKKSGERIEEDYIEEGPTAQFTVHKLWQQKGREDKRLETDYQIRALLEFYRSDPTVDEFFTKYDNILRTRPEDAHKGMNVTTLRTHCKLTGKFYRILQKNFTAPGNIGTTIDEVAKTLDDITYRQWQLSVADCRFRFHQQPIRARDLNIFLQLGDVIRKVKHDFQDNVLFSTSEQVVFTYANEEDLRKILKIATNNGLWVELRVARKLLGELSPDVAALDKIGASFYGTEENTRSLKPPLCEICQMREGEEWVEILKREGRLEVMGVLPEELPTEYVCQTCATIRLRRAPLGKLQEWIDPKGDFKLAWIKIRLDYYRLNTVLHGLYSDYLSSFGLSPAKAQIGFSIISEFQEDYDSFLMDFQKKIFEEFEGENVERVLGDFYCVKIENTSDVIKKLLRVYKELLGNYFPKFLKLDDPSPLTLSVVLSHAKFPFFQCWRILEDNKPDVHIALIGHGDMTVKNKNLEELLLASRPNYRKTALHKLAEVSRFSEALATLRFEDRSKDEDSQTYNQLREKLLPMRMDFRSILTFARILED